LCMCTVAGSGIRIRTERRVLAHHGGAKVASPARASLSAGVLLRLALVRLDTCEPVSFASAASA
jgi:hypothetical protein